MAARVCTGSAGLAFQYALGSEWYARTPHSGSMPHDLCRCELGRETFFECLGEPRGRFQTCTLRFEDPVRVFVFKEHMWTAKHWNGISRMVIVSVVWMTVR